MTFTHIPTSVGSHSDGEAPHRRGVVPNTSAAVSHQSKDTATQRLAGIIYGIVQGQPFKPGQADAPPLANAVKAQIENMTAAFLLSDPVMAYYVDHKDPYPNPWPHLIGFNPAPENLIKPAQEITDSLGAHGTSAVNILGARPDQSIWLKSDAAGKTSVVFDCERDRRAAEAAFASAAINVAIPGELRAAHQLLRYLELRQGEAGKSLAPMIVENQRLPNPPDNTGSVAGFWDPLLRAVGVIDDQGRVTPQAGKLGLIVTATREETLTQARQLLAHETINAVTHPPIAALHAPGAPLYLASATEEKHDQFKQTMTEKGYNAAALTAETIIDSLRFPKEECGSYAGNALEKVRAAVSAYDMMPEAARRQNLEQLGPRYAAGGIASEDSGFQFMLPGIVAGEQFKQKGVAHLVDPTWWFPGPETGPAVISSNYGVFFKCAAVEVERIAKETGRSPNYGITNSSVMAWASADADAAGLRRVIMTSAMRAGTFSARQPVNRAEHKNYRMGDYLYPAGYDGKNETALGKVWEALAGIKPGALQTLALVLGIESGMRVSPALVSDYNAALFTPADLGGAEINVVKKTSKADVTVRQMPIIKAFADVQKEIFAPYDAVGMHFGAGGTKADPAREFIVAASFFFPFVVGKQVRDKYLLGKRGVLHVDAQGIAQKFINIVDKLHELGGIPQEPRKLFKVTNNIMELAEAIGKARKGYQQRYQPYSYAHGPEIIREEGAPSPYGYNSSIFTSAHLEAEYVKRLTGDIATGLCEQGNGIISGYGHKGGMGAITGAVRGLYEAGYDVHHTGITTPYVKFLEGGDIGGQKLNVQYEVQHNVLLKNIHAREEKLCGLSNCGIFTPGGGGTMSELFRYLAIMHGIVANHAAPYIAPLDQIAIIVNPKIPGYRTQHYYDGLIKELPEEILADPRVHVVHKAEEALDVVRAHRAGLTREGRLAAQSHRKAMGLSAAIH